MIPYGRQNITEDDISAVVEVLRSDFVTQGPAIPRFEAEIGLSTGADFAFAMNSATSALHAACFALGLKQGGLLWTSPISFVASANCGLYCGADVDFVDIDSHTINMSVDALRKKLEAAQTLGRLPNVLVVVHMCGTPADMKAIFELSKIYGFKIIEDASHAIGASYNGTTIGDCQYSDVTVFSFHPVKIITTGEGGVATTNDPKIAEQLQIFRSHGVTREPRLMTQNIDDPWYYEQIALGLNYRMTDIQAALGLSQMSRLTAIVERRNQLAERYRELMKDFPLSFQEISSGTVSALHLFTIQLDQNRVRKDRRSVFEALRKAGIGVNVHYIPIVNQPYYQDLGFSSKDFPEAQAYYSRCISIPMYPELTDDQQIYIANSIEASVS